VNGQEIAFSINAGELYSYTLPRRGEGQGDWMIETNVHRIPADRVRVVVFNPRCETQNLDVAMHGKNETREAKCVAVPIWKFRGRIVGRAMTETKALKVHVEYRVKWAPGFLGAEKVGVDQPPPESPQFDVVSVPLQKDGGFSINLPIHAHDQAEVNAEAEERGELVFTLLNTEPKVPIVLGTLRPDQFATESGGLELRTEYPELQFVVKQ
jgi:hypothetical protein